MRLNGNKMGNKGGMFMAQMLQINATLESLDLGDTDLVGFYDFLHSHTTPFTMHWLRGGGILSPFSLRQ